MSNTTTGTILTVVGIWFAILGVSGMESSITDQSLFAGSLVSIVGVGVLGCGVLMLGQVDSRG